jgi:hypothetical protein
VIAAAEKKFDADVLAKQAGGKQQSAAGARAV